VSSSNINRTVLVIRKEISVTIITHHCVPIWFLPVITISKRVVHSAFAQRIIVKFLTNDNLKAAEILTGLRAQFGDETL